MSLEMLITLAILLAAILLFVTEWLRVDVVALCVLLALMLTGTSHNRGRAGRLFQPFRPQYRLLIHRWRCGLPDRFGSSDRRSHPENCWNQ